jgi:diguanylate cyclase (GGDEF)-like protein
MNAIQSKPAPFTVAQFANSDRLPTLPEVALKLLQIAQADEPVYADVSRIIRADPVVSGKILKTVNSALFGFRQKIETIEDAVPKLGLTLLRTLILSFHLSRHEAHSQELKPVLQDLWRSSLTQAVFAELIGENIADADPQSYFLAAMLQDIGVLAMISEAPTPYLSHVLNRAQFPQVTAAERSYFGFSHVEVTVRILERWGLDECFGDALQHHHDRVVPRGASRSQGLAVTLQAATQGTEMLFSNRSSKTPLAPAVRQWASFLQTRLGLTESQAQEIIQEVPSRVREYSAIFSFNIGQDVCSEHVICQAKDLLQEIALQNQMEMIKRAKNRKNWVDHELLYRDSLSGLYNRRFMNDKLADCLDQSLKKRQPMAFLFMDVDEFKSINDNFGHATGDKAIQHVARWLEKSLRKHDLAMRLGGDEFLVVLQKIKELDFEVVAQRITGEIPPLVLDDGEKIEIGLSVGGTFYQPEKGDGSDPNWLIDQADQAMYVAKRSGGQTLSIQKFVGRAG